MKPHVFPVLAASSRDALNQHSHSPRWTRSRLVAWIGVTIAACAAVVAAFAQGPVSPGARDDFSPLVKLAPFVLRGKQLSVSVHARSNGDRRYAEGFAEEVIKVVYEAVTEETGKGLVIVGSKGEPHPIVVFRKFLALAEAGKLDPAVAARRPELLVALTRWEHTGDIKISVSEKRSEGTDLDFDKIANALPLSLEGIGAKLYQLAWEEKFDDAKVDERLRTLRAGDLERRELLKEFDWVFYLPPKGAFDRAIDDIIADALKEGDTGFFARMAIKTALLVVKPKIRQAIEAMRHALMFQTVVQARTQFSEPEMSALTDAYIKTLMPGKKDGVGSEHERAVAAVREQMRLNENKAKNTGDPALIKQANAGSAHGTLDGNTADK